VKLDDFTCGQAGELFRLRYIIIGAEIVGNIYDRDFIFSMVGMHMCITF